LRCGEGRIVFVRILSLLVLASSLAGPARAAGPAPLDYQADANWVCRPDLPGACIDDLTAQVLTADGVGPRELFVPAADAPVDCFYVYPTVSEVLELSATPGVTAAERRAVRQQAARLTSVCRLYAPFYRQITTAGMKPGASPAALAAAGALARADVLAAWDAYVARFNRGRGVVLVGHSQGAAMLVGLIQARIEGRPFQRQLVSAVLPGALILTPTGRAAGGTFKTIEPCRWAAQIGCVVTFNAVRADQPIPPDRALKLPGQELVCTNPAALEGGPAPLTPYLSTRGETIIPALTGRQTDWTREPSSIDAPFVTLPGLLWSECRSDEHGVYLAVSARPRPSDARTGAFVGDWVADGRREPTMGLHLIDLNLTAGDLVRVLRVQADAYRAARGDPGSPAP